MARRRRSAKLAINTNLMLDTLLSWVFVKKAPAVLNSLLFSGSPTTGMTATLLGAGAAAAYGYFMNNNNVFNIGAALGLVTVVEPMVDDLIGGITGLQDGGYFQLNDYGRLNDYTNDPAYRLPSAVYSDSY